MMHNDNLNTIDSIVSDKPEKKGKMWLVQNGKHVDLIHNGNPWFLNSDYTDVEVNILPDELSYQSDKDKSNVEKKSELEDVHAGKYLPYTLLYLLVFFAVLFLLYKLGSKHILKKN